MNQNKDGQLLRNMVLFGRLLRSLGLDVTPTHILDWVEGLNYIDISQRADFKNTARTILVSHRDHLPLFNRAFDLFWQARAENELLELNLDQFAQKFIPDQQKDEIIAAGPEESDQDTDDASEEEKEIIAYTYSDREILRHKNFAGLSPEELTMVKMLMRTTEWNLEQRRTRRKTTASRGKFLDMRRTLRRNLRYGGEPLQLNWRKQKLKRRPLVVICDISGSMERYSRALLEFIYVITNGLEKVEAFTFGTRLTRITRPLQHRNIEWALDQAVGSIHDWGGGTRIGEALKKFNFDWGRRVLGQGAIVLIISDGWDRGDIKLLDREMHRLQLSCHRLIWLNPLLGSEHYRPLTQGIQTALPYVDNFLPAHNLHSLEQLGQLLQKLSEHRPFRTYASAHRQG